MSKKLAFIALMIAIVLLFIFGKVKSAEAVQLAELESISDYFTPNDLDADWDVTGATEIFLKGDSAEITGDGAYFSDDTLYIHYAGKYVLRGTLDGSVQIGTNGDGKIWLLFDGVDITSNTDAPIYIKQADKVFLTLKENSHNTLTFNNNDENSEIDGSIFSRDDLTINGKGDLTVVSLGLHGIVCNDSLVFAGGNINITAKKDAVHAHDEIKICDTKITVSSGDDGLHAGNDDESAGFYFESGCIDITDCYEGIEANKVTIAGGEADIVSRDDGINASGSGATSLVTVTGGDINIVNKTGRDADGIDSNGNIDITGGNIFISVSGNGTNNAIDYGSENGGKFTISGGTIIACGSNQMAEAPDSESPQGFIMQTISGNENDVLSVLDSNGNEIVSREIPCLFTSVLISSPQISVGDTVKLKIGDNETDITVSNVTENGPGGFGGNRGEMPGTDGDRPRGDLRRPEDDFEGRGRENDKREQNPPPDFKKYTVD